MTLESLGALAVLGVAANVVYCVAYAVEIAMQRTALRNRSRSWRWVLWLAGTLLAAALAWYWIADEIYPYSS